MKSRQLILTVIKWRWHGVRWETITPYTSVPNHHRRLKCMQRNCTLRFSRKRFRMLCCCAKKKKKEMEGGKKKKKKRSCSWWFWINTEKMSPEYYFVFLTCRGCRSKPAICHNAPLKWLEICTCTRGVDHRITVSVAVNQGIGFYLGCPKSAHISNTTAMHWGGEEAENTENDQKAILSWGHKGLFFLGGRLLKQGGKKKEKSWKRINNHSDLHWKKKKKTPPNNWTSCCERPF